MKNLSGFTIIVATIFSTIIHFFVLALFDTIPLLPKEIPLRSDIFMVDLVTVETASAVPFEEEKTVQIQEAVEKKKPEEKKEVKKEGVTREEVKEKKEVVEEVKEVKKKEEIKKEDKTVVTDSGTKQEKKEKTEEQPLNLEEQRLAAIERVKQDLATRETDGTYTKSQDYDFKKLENQVKSFWAIPDTLSEEGLNAVIIIEIGKNGELLKTEFEQSSGNNIFDQAVIRAIKKAAPFEPPRGSVPLKIGLRFP